MELRCSTCGKKLISEDKFVKFSCPSCGKETIVRCKTCRTLGRNYVCKECGFKGP